MQEQKEENKQEEKKKASEREFTPFSFFGKSFSFDKTEQKTIKNYREWISKTFNKHPVLSSKYITKLEDVPRVGAKKEDSGKYYDFDLQVKVA